MLDAIDMERRVKRWSRVKKEALIRRDYDSLPALSRRVQAGRCNPLSFVILRGG